MVIVVDDEDRENEEFGNGAQFATPESINFMIKHAKGLVCLPATDTILNKFDLKQMVPDNKEKLNTAFTVSIDGAQHHGITTGISATERAKTIQLFISPTASKGLVSPGHIFPLKAREMGVLKRAGHTEAAVDLARLAGLAPAGVISEIIKDDGEMARRDELFVFAKQHNLKLITIKDLIQHRIQTERFINKIETVDMPTDYGHFQLTCYEDMINKKYHYALTIGEWNANDAGNGSCSRMHYRRCIWISTMRLRATTGYGHENDCKRRQRRHTIHEPRRAGNWHCQQTQGL